MPELQHPRHWMGSSCCNRTAWRQCTELGFRPFQEQQLETSWMSNARTKGQKCRINCCHSLAGWIWCLHCFVIDTHEDGVSRCKPICSELGDNLRGHALLIQASSTFTYHLLGTSISGLLVMQAIIGVTSAICELDMWPRSRPPKARGFYSLATARDHRLRVRQRGGYDNNNAL